MSATNPAHRRLFWNSHAFSLWAVCCATLGVGLIFGFQPPLMAFVLSRDGASSAAIGAVTSIGTVAVLLLSPLYPRTITQLGTRNAMLVGVGVAIAILLVMPQWPDIRVWFALRFVSGCGLGLAWIASEVWLNTLSTDESRSKVLGIYSTVFAAGVMAGPLLLQLIGTAGPWPFYIGAGCLALTVVPLLAVRRSAAEIERKPKPERRLLQLLRDAPLAMLAALSAGLVESADISLLPVLGLRHGLDEQSSLYLVTVFLAGNVLLQLPIGVLADRLGRSRALAGCAVVGVIGPLLLIPAMSSQWLLWTLLFVWGGTLYGFYTQGIAMVGDSYPPEELAAANAAFVVVYCAGGIVGPSLGGAAMDLWVPNGLAVYLSCAPLLLLVAPLARFLTRRRTAGGP
ncbi:MAG TPA: MFS transporter [Steroidobacteraceae bacterium]|nr:MFS transporter [Steroidobacteraceae bacterium]